MKLTDRCLMNHLIPLKNKVKFLLRPNIYPQQTSSVKAIETHMSWVFITDNFAYKLKKPVHYAYRDFRTVAARYNNCEKELELNRRLAKDIYLELVSLNIDHTGQLQLSGTGETIDWLVKMRKLPESRMLDNMIINHQVTENDVREFALVLINFYKKNPTIELTFSQFERRLQQEIKTSYTELNKKSYPLSGSQIKIIADKLNYFITANKKLLQRRIREKRIIEVHGDLRPEHICCLQSRPVIIDCLEFNRELRLLDPLEELAFLSMECENLKANFIGKILFATYYSLIDDKAPDQLIHFYQCLHAFIRARLVIRHIKEPRYKKESKWLINAKNYLGLAERFNASE